ncbi:nitrogen fixation protein FixH [Erythrobacter sp. Dej080120_24]|uniref:FixH family protein n=1 Tax=Erythrobacter sp. Dej080120_24 TaxID=3024837 RepID=UPI00291E8CC3|nr:nitrogen fixation protein FixH [Erythrobacter sp. Dej080120_24]
MAETSRKGTFTGRHMVGIMIVGFGIVVAVNFYMASLAVGGFHGVVVENSYVASQKFNGWMEDAEASRALGWEVQASREDAGFVVITTTDVPAGADIKAELRRPLGDHEFASLTFEDLGNGVYRSSQPVDGGRWTMRLFIEAGDKHWAEESELK